MNADFSQKPCFFNKCFEKNTLKALITWALLNFGERKTLNLVEKLKILGFMYATRGGISLGLDDLKTPPTKIWLISEAEKQTQKTQNEYDQGNLTAVEKFQQLIDSWHRTSELLKQDVIQNFKNTDILNPVYMMAFSGARGNISQVRQLVGMRGLMADPQGQIIDFPIRSNFREGLTLTEYVISCYGARKGLVDTALRTANSGYLTRRLVDVSQHVIIGWMNCGTSRGVLLGNMTVQNKIVLPIQSRLVGRVLAEDLPPIGFRNQQISLELASKISRLKEKVLIRSPLTCKHKKFLCQLCYGWSLAYGNLVAMGEAVGVLAAQSIGEPGTQLTMRTFHTGGVFSGSIVDEIRAPFDGIAFFNASLPGKIIRTSYGNIAFFTKKQGEVVLCSFSKNQILNQIQDYSTKKKPVSNIETRVSVPETSFFEKETKESAELIGKTTQTIKFFLPEHTILFVRNGTNFNKGQLIAEFSSLTKKKNEQIRAEHRVYSEKTGQIFLNRKKVFDQQNISETSQVFLSTENRGQTRKNEMDTLWILSGKIYTSFFSSPLFIKKGDIVDKTAIINQSVGLTTNRGIVASDKIQNNFNPGVNTTPDNMSTKVDLNLVNCTINTNLTNSKTLFSKISSKTYLQLKNNSNLLASSQIHEKKTSYKQVVLKQRINEFQVKTFYYKGFSYFFSIVNSSKKANIKQKQYGQQPLVVEQISNNNQSEKNFDIFFTTFSLKKKSSHLSSKVHLENTKKTILFQWFPKHYQTKKSGFLLSSEWVNDIYNFEKILFWIYEEFYQQSFFDSEIVVISNFNKEKGTKKLISQNKYHLFSKNIVSKENKKKISKNKKKQQNLNFVKGWSCGQLPLFYISNRQIKKNPVYSIGFFHLINCETNIEKKEIDDLSKLYSLPSFRIISKTKSPKINLFGLRSKNKSKPRLLDFNHGLLTSKQSILLHGFFQQKKNFVTSKGFFENPFFLMKSIHRGSFDKPFLSSFQEKMFGSPYLHFQLTKRNKIKQDPFKNIFQNQGFSKGKTIDSLHGLKPDFKQSISLHGSVEKETSFAISETKSNQKFPFFSKKDHSEDMKNQTHERSLKKANSFNNFDFVYRRKMVETFFDLDEVKKDLKTNNDILQRICRSDIKQNRILKNSTAFFAFYQKRSIKQNSLNTFFQLFPFLKARSPQIIEKKKINQDKILQTPFHGFSKGKTINSLHGLKSNFKQSTLLHDNNATSLEKNISYYVLRKKFKIKPGWTYFPMDSNWILKNWKKENHIQFYKNKIDLLSFDQQIIFTEYLPLFVAAFEKNYQSNFAKATKLTRPISYRIRTKKRNLQNYKVKPSLNTFYSKHNSLSNLKIILSSLPTATRAYSDKNAIFLLLLWLQSKYGNIKLSQNQGKKIGSKFLKVRKVDKRTKQILGLKKKLGLSSFSSSPTLIEKKKKNFFSWNCRNTNFNKVVISCRESQEYSYFFTKSYFSLTKSHLGLNSFLVAKTHESRLNLVKKHSFFQKRSSLKNPWVRRNLQVIRKTDFPFSEIEKKKIDIFHITSVLNKSENKKITNFEFFKEERIFRLKNSFWKKKLLFFIRLKLIVLSKQKIIQQRLNGSLSKVVKKELKNKLADFIKNHQIEKKNTPVLANCKPLLLDKNKQFSFSQNSHSKKERLPVILFLLRVFYSTHFNSKTTINFPFLAQNPYNLFVFGFTFFQPEEFLVNYYPNEQKDKFQNINFFSHNKRAQNLQKLQVLISREKKKSWWNTQKKPAPFDSKRNSLNGSQFRIFFDEKKNNPSCKKDLAKRCFKNFQPHFFLLFRKIKPYSLLHLHQYKKTIYSLNKQEIFSSYDLTSSKTSFAIGKTKSNQKLKPQNLFTHSLRQKKTKLFSFEPSFDIEIKRLTYNFHGFFEKKQSTLLNRFISNETTLNKSNQNRKLLHRLQPPFLSKKVVQRLAISALPLENFGLNAINTQVKTIRFKKNQFFDQRFFLSLYNYSAFWVGNLSLQKNFSSLTKETWISTKQPTLLKNFFSPFQGEIVRSNLNSNCIIITNGDTITLSTSFSDILRKDLLNSVNLNFQKKKLSLSKPFFFVGKVIRARDKVEGNKVALQAGQIIQIETKKLILRHAYPVLLSSGSIFHVQHNSFVEKNTQLFTLFYQIVKTGDIVQGIPKIEQLFEARGPLIEGRRIEKRHLFISGLSAKFWQIYVNYRQKFSNKIAVRKSFQEIQQILVQDVYMVYQEQGVSIAEKHLEIIVRQMTSFVLVVNPGGTRFLPGEILSIDLVEKANKYLFFLDPTGQKYNANYYAQYVPVLFGITKAALRSEGFISAASFQETTRVLSQAAIEKKKDYLRGLKENVVLGRVIPAGTGFPMWRWKKTVITRKKKTKSKLQYVSSRFDAESLDNLIL